MKLIVGLGNPGKKYEKTRHNAGFRIVDTLAERLGAEFKSEKFHAKIAKHEEMILAKPQTFMNNSGEAVAALLAYFKIKPQNLLVIHDEIDLPLGKIKISVGRGSAGHNGIESIINHVGQGFNRLRVGIENRETFRVPETDAFVLQNFTAAEEEKLKKIIPEVIKQIDKFLNND